MLTVKNGQNQQRSLGHCNFFSDILEVSRIINIWYIYSNQKGIVEYKYYMSRESEPLWSLKVETTSVNGVHCPGSLTRPVRLSWSQRTSIPPGMQIVILFINSILLSISLTVSLSQCLLRSSLICILLCYFYLWQLFY